MQTEAKLAVRRFKIESRRPVGAVKAQVGDVRDGEIKRGRALRVVGSRRGDACNRRGLLYRWRAGAILAVVGAVSVGATGL